MVFCAGDSTQNNEADNAKKASDRVTDDTKACPVCGETHQDRRPSSADFATRTWRPFETAKEAEVERELFVGRPKPITSAGEWAIVVLTLGIAFLFYWIRSLSMRYRITTQRVQIEHGLFSTTKDNVELFRIDHFDLHKPFGMRIMNECMLHLRSSDPHFPTVMLRGIPDLEALADTLRECSLRERSRRRVTTFVEA